MSRLEEALTKAEGPMGESTSAPLPPPTIVAEPVSLSYLNGIYTNLAFSLQDIAHPLVAVASSVPKEGVSTLLFYLAQVAATERKVAVVDFNFINPRLHKLFQTDNIRGLSDVLQGRKSLEDCITSTGVPNLDLLPCGPTGVACFQILASAPLRKMLADLRSRYELVLLDCPPLRRHPDTAILATLCDGIVLVVKARKTKREVIQYAQGLIEKAGARQLGMILNRVKYWIPEFLYRRL
jgi:capsular exopolysaccharide synthesis family protein